MYKQTNMILLNQPYIKQWAWVSLLILIATLTFSKVFADAQAQPPLTTTILLMNGVELEAEMAHSGQQRYMGLSFRESLGANKGMLFIYQQEQELAFVMRNTLIPLSIAYISSDFVINEIHDMPTGSDKHFVSKKPAQYALEVNQGWFEKHNIKAGMKITPQ